MDLFKHNVWKLRVLKLGVRGENSLKMHISITVVKSETV